MTSGKSMTQHLSIDNLPDDLRTLTDDVRRRAVDAANTLVEQGYKVPVAMSMAAERARSWSGLGDGTVAHHVVPHGDGWAVIKADAERASAILPTKDEAVARGREIARNQHGKLVVHGQDGMVQDTVNYADA